MKVYKDSSEFIKEKNAVVTVGSFDGLHIGHFKIINELKKIGREINGHSVLLTFEPHPRQVIWHDADFKILTSFEEKKTILENSGIDHLVVQNFTRAFSQMTSDEFIKKILVDILGVSHIVVGHDHKFGKDRLGDTDKLKELGKKFGFDVISVPAEKIGGEIIGSTAIRSALADGNIDKANLFFGRNYSFCGIVVKGSQRGRTLGFPTANIKLDDPAKAIPKRGVYAVTCTCEGQRLKGIMNIGMRPTFEDKTELIIEVHLFNFNKDIYGENLSVDFIKRLRDEKKFVSKDELIHQIELDKNAALEILKSA
jgi:riboflavin kinase / FMN adenylyltransferase